MNNTHFDIEYLRRYVQGELPPAEMHQIEIAAQEDEMLMDIIEGLEFEHHHLLSSTQIEIHNRILERTEQKTIPIKKKLPFRQLGIAASIIFILGLSTVFYYYTLKKNDFSPLIATVEEGTNVQSTPLVNYGVETDSTNVNIEDTNTKENIISAKKPITNQKSLDKETVLEIAEQPLLASIDAKKIEPTSEKQQKSSSNQIIEEEVIQFKKGQQNKEQVLLDQQVILSESKDSGFSIKINESIAQQRAKLNRMNLSPETRRMLNEALDKQEYEELNTQRIAAQNKASSHNFHIADANQVAVASPKSQEKKLENTLENQALLDEVVIVTNNSSQKIRKSEPQIGYDEYKKILVDKLEKLTNEKYNFKIQFKLNLENKPSEIIFLKSSHPNLEEEIKKEISNGTKWIPGKNADKIIFEIKK